MRDAEYFVNLYFPRLPIEAVPFEMYLETAQLMAFTIEYK